MNTRAELDAFFERVPEHVLVVVDQAYFEYIDREDYPDAAAEYIGRGTGRSSCARSRRSTAWPACASATRSGLRRSAPRWRRSAGRSTSSRLRRSQPSRASARRPSWHGAAPSTPRAWCGSRSCSRDSGFDPVPAVGNFLFADTGGLASAELFDALLHEGVIVRPLAGFGAPTAIRVTVGTPEELDFFAAALGNVLARR